MVVSNILRENGQAIPIGGTLILGEGGMQAKWCLFLGETCSQGCSDMTLIHLTHCKLLRPSSYSSFTVLISSLDSYPFLLPSSRNGTKRAYPTCALDISG